MTDSANQVELVGPVSQSVNFSKSECVVEQTYSYIVEAVAEGGSTAATLIKGSSTVEILLKGSSTAVTNGVMIIGKACVAELNPTNQGFTDC